MSIQDDEYATPAYPSFCQKLTKVHLCYQLIKKIVTDEAMLPVAVLIDYQDWQKIEEILTDDQLQQINFDLNKYAGVIKLTQYPWEYQQKIREESYSC